MSTTRFHSKIVRALTAVPLVVAVGASMPAQADHDRQKIEYVITELGPLGGTSSAGASVNERGWVAGTANLAGDEVAHATLWRHGTAIDLGTLGGPGANSAVLWPVKSNRGMVVGIAETDEMDPREEAWSCSFFFPGGPTGRVCRGFVWQHGQMRALDTFGGTHGFASGANDRGQVVGWAETANPDSTCNEPQELGFRAAVWDTRHEDRIRELPPLPGDTVSSATAINNRGQVVGISGICANAIGGFSARHAVLWEDGEPTHIGNFGGAAWNTPMAVNDLGAVVGFANQADTEGANFNEVAFLWTEQTGIHNLGALEGDSRSQALGVNDQGRVVGLSRTTGEPDTAFVWADGAMKDLNALSPGYSGHLLYANDISNRGVITGQAIDAETGERVAFRATPTTSTTSSH